MNTKPYIKGAEEKLEVGNTYYLGQLVKNASQDTLLDILDSECVAVGEDYIVDFAVIDADLVDPENLLDTEVVITDLPTLEPKRYEFLPSDLTPEQYDLYNQTSGVDFDFWRDQDGNFYCGAEDNLTMLGDLQDVGEYLEACDKDMGEKRGYDAR